MGDSKLARTHENRITQEFLCKIMRKARKTFKLPAIAVTVMNSQTISLQEVLGIRTVDGQEQATVDDFFHIGSCSKSVLALMAARLVEQNRITWQTKFFEVFPELKVEADGTYSEITLEDLFVCKAGIKPYTDGKTERFPDFESSVDNKRLEFIKYLVKLPPATKKNSGKFQHLYSNASYALASAMLEKVSGKSYEDLVKEMISGDLGLPVHVGWPNCNGENQPWGHTITEDGIIAFPPDHEYTLPYLISPAGDLSMTPRSYAKFTQLHLHGLRGGDNYISSSAYRYIHYGHDGFSLGVANGVLGGIKFSGIDGTAGTFFCRSIMVPQADFAFTIMTNVGSGSGSVKAVDWLTMQIAKKQFNWWWKFWL